MHSPEFKARIALEALSGNKTQAQLCQEHDLHANQINDWRQQLILGAKGVFGAPAAKEVDTTAMEAKIVRLTLENDFLERALGISRGTVYYLPAPTPPADTATAFTTKRPDAEKRVAKPITRSTGKISSPALPINAATAGSNTGTLYSSVKSTTVVP